MLNKIKKLILNLVSKILYKIGQPKSEDKHPLIYFDFDHDDKNDILELADKLAMLAENIGKEICSECGKEVSECECDKSEAVVVE